MRHIYFIATLAWLLIRLSACGIPNTNPSPEEINETLQGLLAQVIDDSFEQIPGVSATIIAPDLHLNWTGSAGFDSKEMKDSLSAQQPFRIASITKTFVAAAILRLHEMDSLDIDAPIGRYISTQHLQLLIDNDYAVDSITLRQCLNHTSGIYDYAMRGQSFAERIISNPQKRWTRTEQIQLAMETGEATGHPGESYAYGDTGYILAGEVIEMQTDTNLGQGLRQLLGFNQLNMPNTWLETIEPAPANLLPYVHRYARGYEATTWDASIDLYGGGGLVSTTDDLANFFQALFNQQVYQQSTTLDLMLEAPVYAATYNPTEDERYKDYRQGLWRINLFGEVAYIHRGLWGSTLLYIPAYNCTIAVNATAGQPDRLIKQLVLVVKNLHEGKT